MGAREGRRGNRGVAVVRGLFAVCVFNFPRPFCMQISSVIYREWGREGVTEGCTCGG